MPGTRRTCGCNPFPYAPVVPPTRGPTACRPSGEKRERYRSRHREGLGALRQTDAPCPPRDKPVSPFPRFHPIATHPVAPRTFPSFFVVASRPLTPARSLVSRVIDRGWCGGSANLPAPTKTLSRVEAREAHFDRRRGGAREQRHRGEPPPTTSSR